MVAIYGILFALFMVLGVLCFLDPPANINKMHLSPKPKDDSSVEEEKKFKLVAIQREDLTFDCFVQDGDETCGQRFVGNTSRLKSVKQMSVAEGCKKVAIKFINRRNKIKGVMQKKADFEKDTNGWTYDKLHTFQHKILPKIAKCVKELEEIPGGFFVKVSYDYDLGRKMEELDKIHHEYLDGLKEALAYGKKLAKELESKKKGIHV